VTMMVVDYEDDGSCCDDEDDDDDSYRGHSGAVPAAAGQCLCVLERQFAIRRRIPLRTGYAFVIYFFITSLTVQLPYSLTHSLSPSFL
jgi:hypothetical protein